MMFSVFSQGHARSLIRTRTLLRIGRIWTDLDGFGRGHFWSSFFVAVILNYGTSEEVV